jgi:photosynthetic reaction center cytochrome c subunit
MKIRIGFAVLSASVLCAQTANFGGVWKTNPPARTSGSGPAPPSYLMIVEQQGPKLSELIGMYGPRGELRSSLTYNTDEKPSMNSFHGLPMRTQASWNGGTLVLESKIAGRRPSAMTERYTLSSDGKTLTVDSVTTMNGRDIKQSLVFEKQPDSAAEPLRKPEETAGVRFKNVKVMKEVPASQFLDSMRTFTMALGVDCEHCHVQNKNDSDEKKEKLTARKMLEMTHAINQQNFKGKMEVRCYTCHQGQKEPAKIPAL